MPARRAPGAGRRWLLAAAALITSAAAGAAATDRYPAAAAALLVVADGQALWAHEPALPRPPASLAKLMTALVLVDEDWHPDARVVASPHATAIDGSRLGLRAGEALLARDALVALLVRSANDVCIALAEHAAGSVAAFAARMNAKATALGLADSHFVQPCGLDAAGQHTSARDLYTIARTALERPAIARAVATESATITTLGGRAIAINNTNLLLGRIGGVVGMKSGYTSGAGRCVVAVAERGGHRVWLVMLGAPNRWWVAAGIIDAAFAQIGATAPPAGP